MRCLIIVLMTLSLSSCQFKGRLYTDITQPYSTNFDRSPIGLRSCVIEDFRIQEPLSQARISAEWTRGKIAERLQEANITTMHYADLNTKSYFFGLYGKKKLVIYGD